MASIWSHALPGSRFPMTAFGGIAARSAFLHHCRSWLCQLGSPATKELPTFVAQYWHATAASWLAEVTRAALGLCAFGFNFLF